MDRTDSEIDTSATRGRSGPVRYELIDKDGNEVIFKSPNGEMRRRFTFETARSAAEYATKLWPDQSQDPDRTGKGWDVQVAVSSR